MTKYRTLMIACIQRSLIGEGVIHPTIVYCGLRAGFSTASLSFRVLIGHMKTLTSLTNMRTFLNRCDGSFRLLSTWAGYAKASPLQTRGRRFESGHPLSMGVLLSGRARVGYAIKVYLLASPPSASSGGGFYFGANGNVIDSPVSIR